MIDRWAVPGINEVIDPPKRPVITIHEARRAYKRALGGPEVGMSVASYTDSGIMYTDSGRITETRPQFKV